MPSYFEKFPLFRVGVVAPEIGLNQLTRIWDGFNSYDPSEFAELSLPLPGREAIMVPILKERIGLLSHVQ